MFRDIENMSAYESNFYYIENTGGPNESGV